MPHAPITVYRARKIITMNPMQPEATHVAVREGCILSVGDRARVGEWGAHTLDERFADKVLMPGFVEGHCHLVEGQMWRWHYLGWFDRTDDQGRTWKGLSSMEAVVQRLIEIDAGLRAAGRPGHEPIVCWGFDPIYFGGERMTVRHLDRASATRRIVVSHANGHLMSVNSVVLRDAGITRDSEIEGTVRFPDGEPNGELQEPAAMFPVVKLMSRAGLMVPVDEAGLRGFGRVACRTGVTTATDLANKLGADAELALLRRVTDDDAYPVRLVPAFHALPGHLGAQEGAAYARSLLSQSTDRLRFGLVKMLLDGSIQGFTARLRWPGHFNGAPNGIWVTSPAQYEADLEAYHRAGLRVHTHTNGDEASLAAIDATERVLARAPRPDHRHTLQHAQMIDAPMFRRMAALGMGVNLFANHLWYWGDQHHEMTLGPDRAQRLDACGSAQAAGVRYGIHSDAPVTPLGPLFTAWCAVNRVTPKGRVLGEAERISVAQALHAITLGVAWTLKLDHEIGSIECGKRADFAVLEEDPTALDPMALKDVGVWGTVLSGRVHEAVRGAA